ncbi:MAG: hypothetical protein LW832_06455 [Parachlamydia sp.]|jgi:hypothetical protein|nr:hypothetical protein [Parachlamydia sp.]
MTLAHIQKILEKAQILCTLLPESDSFLTETLLVSFGLDAKQKEKTLFIQAFPMKLDTAQLKSEPIDSAYRIQFTCPFHFEALNAAMNQTASLLLFLNQLIDWPGFELNELTNKISYRIVWLVKESALDAQQILTLIGSIVLTTDLFSEAIEKIALGHSTFNDLLSEVEQLTSNT